MQAIASSNNMRGRELPVNFAPETVALGRSPATVTRSGEPSAKAGANVFGLDGDHLAALLKAAARAGESVTYSEALAALGHRFSRPRMRALCVVLTDLDAAERGAGRPGLAILVVRQSDRLPGQGWWLGLNDYKGLFTGVEAASYVAKRQREVFAAWR